MLLLYVCLLSVAYAQNPIVNTTQGEIQGALATDGNYYVFYGIHYAGSVAGANRFKAPVAPERYPGTYHAVDNTVLCAQPSDRGLIGVEDCLVLNIHTRNLTTSNPVLVYLQGEEYSSVDPTVRSYRRLVESDLLVITINYRLSIFGFLCLGVPEAPGNAGLKDIILGLKWIKDNIAGFGGDPNNVVLFGHGSGAAMVDLITMSPLATNLVHKAITQSGSALAPWAISYNPIRYAEDVGVKLSYSGQTRQGLAEKLLATDVSLLGPVLSSYEFLNNTALFAPCIENKELNDTFLTDAPINLLRSGNYLQIPYLTGYSNLEGTFRAGKAITSQWLEKMQANFTDFLQADLAFGSDANRTAVANSTREFYFQQAQISMATIEDYLAYHGDTMFLVSVIRGARERALTSQADVRLGEFAYRGTLNSDWIYSQIPLSGVKHGGLLNYAFDFDLRPEDEPARVSVVARIAAFAKTGNPTNTSLSQVTWLPISNGTLNYIYYGGGESTVPGTANLAESARQDPHSGRMTFWNNIYTNYYNAPSPVSSADKALGFAFVILISQFFVRIL